MATIIVNFNLNGKTTPVEFKSGTTNVVSCSPKIGSVLIDDTLRKLYGFLGGYLHQEIEIFAFIGVYIVKDKKGNDLLKISDTEIRFMVDDEADANGNTKISFYEAH